MKIENDVIEWLLGDDEPSIRYRVLTELLDEPINTPQATNLRFKIAKSDRVLRLFSGQEKNGGFGVHDYDKWMGAHWRLAALVDLALPEGDKRAIKAVKMVLGWLASSKHLKSIKTINGLTRRCASQEGNALAVCCRLGMTDDPRVAHLAESLIAWQWPDGGWNCDKSQKAHHSSFHESVLPMWGLLEYHHVTGDKRALEAANRTGEFLLRHRLFRSEKTSKVIDTKMLAIRYPHYWHYDFLQGLRVLTMIGKIKDPRASEALDMLMQKRLPDGRWKADGYHWKSVDTKERYSSPVDWWRRQPNKMITHEALRILKEVGKVRL